MSAVFERAKLDAIGFGFGVRWIVEDYRVGFEVAAIITDHVEDMSTRTVDTRPQYHLKGARDGLEMTPDMDQADLYLVGSIKWDGCSEVNFDSEGLHLCGRGCWQDHIALMAWLWKRAGELMHQQRRAEDFKPLSLPRGE